METKNSDREELLRDLRSCTTWLSEGDVSRAMQVLDRIIELPDDVVDFELCRLIYKVEKAILVLMRNEVIRKG